jgi:hypothetical protein
MHPRRALLTGAGISAGPPASLPLGHRLDELLRLCCFEAAARVAPDAVDPVGLATVGGRGRNLIARLAACAGTSSVEDLLRCFHVTVPNEGHLLAAVHAVRGTLHVTMNFDDGIETAYALLGGTAQLPPTTPGEFHRALEDWRRAVRPTSPLRVEAAQFAAVDFDHRPLLIHLRGSSKAGWDQTLIPKHRGATVDPPWLNDDQMIAVREAIKMDHLAIAGVSGAHHDCRTTLLPLLRRGRFSWTSAEMRAEMISLVSHIDPRQPTLRPAVEGLRSALPGADDLPRWPRTGSNSTGFDVEFASWRRRLPVDSAAEAYAWLLSESGLHPQAIAVLRALLLRQSHGLRAPALRAAVSDR